MRLKVNRDELLKALNIAFHAIGTKTPMPILNNFKLEMEDTGFLITSSNSEISIRTRVPLIHHSKTIITDYKVGSTLVSAKLLNDIVRKMNSETLSLELFDNTILHVSDAKSKFQLNSIKVEEYPDIDLIVQGVKLDVDTKAFKELVDQTAFSASTKEQRPIMMALNLEATTNKLIATATDSSRLARKEISVEGNTKFIVNPPARVLMQVAGLLSPEGKISLSVTDKKILFSFDQTIIASRLIGGEYPPTANIIPKSSNFYFEANAKEFISAMERVSVMSVERENIIKLTITDKGAEVSSRSAQVGSANETLTQFKYSGDTFNISFNAEYVIAAIKATGAIDIKLGFIGETKPFVIKNDKDVSLIQLGTPIRTF
jgi:DNA polymerase-3 subunit beta